MCFSGGNSNNGSRPLAQIFMSVACKLLFIAGKIVNDDDCVEKYYFVAENLL